MRNVEQKRDLPLVKKVWIHAVSIKFRGSGTFLFDVAIFRFVLLIKFPLKAFIKNSKRENFNTFSKRFLLI